MAKKNRVVAVLAPLATLVLTGTASAATLGITTPPSSSMPNSCTGATFVQATDSPSTPYIVPAGGGEITQWQTNTIDDTSGAAGAQLTFAVLRPSEGDYTVVGADTVNLPNPLPASHIASYPLATPIAVQAGDTLALHPGSSAIACYYFGGATPGGDTVDDLVDSSPPSTGQTLAPSGSASPPTFVMNVAATFVPANEDAAVTTSAGPSGAAAGRPALLSSAVTNNGPGPGPITFVDHVPAGLTINSAAAGDGTCSTSGQTIACTISGLAAGQSVPVDLVVTPTAAGSYSNGVSVAVASGITDPNASNNTASATLTVGPVPPFRSATCIVPKLKGISAGFAKTVLKDLGCKVKSSKAHSSSVHTGLVVKTKPGSGKYAYQRKIKLVVSSGP